MKHNLKHTLNVIRTIHCGNIKKPITKISKISGEDIEGRNKCIFVISDFDNYKMIDVYFPHKSDMYYHTLYRFDENDGMKPQDWKIDVNVVLPKEVFQKAYVADNVYVGEINEPFFKIDEMKAHSYKAPKKHTPAVRVNIRKMF